MENNKENLQVFLFPNISYIYFHRNLFRCLVSFTKNQAQLNNGKVWTIGKTRLKLDLLLQHTRVKGIEERPQISIT